MRFIENLQPNQKLTVRALQVAEALSGSDPSCLFKLIPLASQKFIDLSQPAVNPRLPKLARAPALGLVSLRWCVFRFWCAIPAIHLQRIAGLRVIGW